MLRTLTTAALAATALLACAPAASAQDFGGDWSFSFGAATDNRSKDASKSDGEPFVWGEAEWESDSGFFYVTPAFETIKASTGSDLEVALAAGIRPEFAGFDFDLKAEHKWHVDADPGADDDAWEFTADMKRSIGPAKGRLRLQHSPDSAGSSQGWMWYEAQVGWDFTDKLSGSAAIGRREQETSVDYTGYNVGVTYVLTRNMDAELRWYGTDVDAPGEQYADALVAGISFSF